jgi:hypothetical protein
MKRMNFPGHKARRQRVALARLKQSPKDSFSWEKEVAALELSLSKVISE